MTRISSQRLTRLENLAAPIIAGRWQREAAADIRLRRAAGDHATKLVTLILHGDSRIEEPLAIAWHRALSGLDLVEIPEAWLPARLRAKVIASLPGDTEKDKFGNVLSSAPPWLLTFCMASIDGYVLGIDLPKNSQPSLEPGCDALDDMESWPDLPIGTLAAGGPVPELDLSALDALPDCFHALNCEEVIDLSGLLEKGEKNWSRRDRRRRKAITAKLLRTNFPEWAHHWPR